ncbi:MAG: hypothetical protein KDB27_28590, partial [Planctomycetales bacterium]|nr:hypothetical protein [Planctomycetales bacterium]
MKMQFLVRVSLSVSCLVMAQSQVGFGSGGTVSATNVGDRTPPGHVAGRSKAAEAANGTSAYFCPAYSSIPSGGTGGANGPFLYTGPGLSVERAFAAASQTPDPVFLADGIKMEYDQDLSIPGITKKTGWAFRRQFNSKLVAASGGTELAGSNGLRWHTDSLPAYIRPEGSDVESYPDASAKQVFTGASYTPPEGINATFTAEAGDTYKLVDNESGVIKYYYGWDTSTDAKNRGRLKESTTREFESASEDGIVYGYNSNGDISATTTSQTGLLTFSYYGTGVEADRINTVTVYDGSFQPTQSVTYEYFGNGSPHSDVGSNGDLVQVKTEKDNSSGSSDIVRYTQYRYYSTSGGEHQMKMVFEPEAMERIMNAGDTAVDTASEILGKADTYTVSGTGKAIEDFASKRMTYYSSNVSTASLTTPFYANENLESKYGGTNTSEYSSTDGYGMIKTETIQNSGCGCSGGSASGGITLTYAYMDLNGGSSTDPRDVVRIIVEDREDADGTNLSRRLYGLNTNGTVLREANCAAPGTGIDVWCVSTLLDADGRVIERRMPSAHTSVDSDADLKKFLNPTSGTNDSDTLDNSNGLIEVYEYTESSGLLISMAKKVKKGENGTAYYVSYTKYGDDTNDKPNWAVIETRVYDSKVSANPSTNGIATTYSYTFHDAGDTQMKIKTTTLPTISTGQNGSGTATTTQQYYDDLGRLRWTKDGEGYVNYYSYHPETGGVAYQMVDVNTSSLASDITSGSSGKWVAWSGSAGLTRDAGNPTALELVTKTEYDEMARKRLVIDPAGEEHYTAYADGVTYEFPHWE